MPLHAVYRMYAADGELLYVGSTASIEQRLRNHAYLSSPWIQEIARIDVEWHPDIKTGRAAEDEAIASENPRYNVIGTPRQGTWFRNATRAEVADGHTSRVGRILDPQTGQRVPRASQDEDRAPGG